MPTIEERVAKGVEYMDTFAPADWRERINLETFDIAWPDDCVFGQVFGGWSEYIEDFYENTDNASVFLYGFDGWTEHIDALNAEWKRVLSI